MLCENRPTSSDTPCCRVGIDYAELRRLLGDAVVGLHSMVDEHFGISVVEYMAAGSAMQCVHHLFVLFMLPVSCASCQPPT